MKLRLILTGLVIAVWCIVNKLIDLYYSPMTGKITANALNGDSNDYAFAKFIQNGGLSDVTASFAVFIIIIIWLTKFFGNKNQN